MYKLITLKSTFLILYFCAPILCGAQTSDIQNQRIEPAIRVRNTVPNNIPATPVNGIVKQNATANTKDHIPGKVVRNNIATPISGLKKNSIAAQNKELKDSLVHNVATPVNGKPH